VPVRPQGLRRPWAKERF